MHRDDLVASMQRHCFQGRPDGYAFENGIWQCSETQKLRNWETVTVLKVDRWSGTGAPGYIGKAEYLCRTSWHVFYVCCKFVKHLFHVPLFSFCFPPAQNLSFFEQISFCSSSPSFCQPCTTTVWRGHPFLDAQPWHRTQNFMRHRCSASAVLSLSGAQVHCLAPFDVKAWETRQTSSVTKYQWHRISRLSRLSRHK